MSRFGNFFAVGVLLVLGSACLAQESAPPKPNAGKPAAPVKADPNVKPAAAVSAADADSAKLTPKLSWRATYAEGTELAEKNRQMLVVWFFDPKNTAENEQFQKTLRDSEVVKRLANFTLAKLPKDHAVTVGGVESKLLSHGSMQEMQGSSGIAIIDLTDPQSKQFRQVVSVYPFSRSLLDAYRLSVLLGLPKGSLTQRTLTYFVRIHPENPASAWSDHSEMLAHEAEKHSSHQAAINVQGHHNWDSRFHAINAQIGGSLVAQEVCAESWPGQSLLDAAEECVHSWRQSSGHWGAVRSRHALFGYDMKRGSRGVWYGTGIFAQFR